jgi:Ser/Thr protein kinase RdoA (MazF antagonist)
MVLGRKLAEGGSSEVYEWSPGRVVKLFRTEYAFAIERETGSARAINAAGIPSPAVHCVVEVDGRRGIVFDAIPGPTLLDQLLRGEVSPATTGDLLGRVHLAMHAVDVPSLPALAEAVRGSGFELPDGPIVFHGDFHPGNVVMSPAGPVTIDWVNAHRAPAAADVARSVMAVRYQALRPDQPAGALEREREVRSGVLDAYLTTYLEDAPGVADELGFWLTQSARSLLRQEDDTADVADLHALKRGELVDVGEPALARFAQR